MGLFSKLKKITKNVIDPAGHVFKDKPAAAAAPAVDPMAGAGAATNPAQYGGDTQDPAYGSFTKPFGVEDFYENADPGYGFQLQQGSQAVLNSAGVGGSALGGAALKDLLKYNQDYAGSAYQGAFDRYQTSQSNIFNRLFSLTQLGQNAAAGVGSQGTALAGAAGTNTANAGSAAGAGIVGAGNAATSGLNNAWLYGQYAGGAGQRPVGTGGDYGGGGFGPASVYGGV